MLLLSETHGAFHIEAGPQMLKRMVGSEVYIWKLHLIQFAFLIPQVVMAGAFYPNYFTFGYHDDEVAMRELSGKDPKTTIMVSELNLSSPLSLCVRVLLISFIVYLKCNFVLSVLYLLKYLHSWCM